MSNAKPFSICLSDHNAETLNRARPKKIEIDPDSAPDREWFDDWHARLSHGGTAKVAERMSNASVAFSKWTDEPLPGGPVKISDLVRDPRLRIPFAGEFHQPKLGPLVQIMTFQTAVPLEASSSTDPNLLVAASVSFSGPLHGAMKLLAESDASRGEWERNSSGYIFHSRMANRQQAAPVPSNNRIGRLFVVNAVIVLGLGIAIACRRQFGKLSS